MTITRHLRDEHQSILKGLSGLGVFADRLAHREKIHFGDLRVLVFAIGSFILNCHHAKEEQILFPLLAANPKLREGGPRCTYFMGLRIFEQAPSPQLPTGFEGTPLVIPVSEHRQGHDILLNIRRALDSAEGNPSDLKNLDVLSSFLQYYIRHLRLHVEKEETCLLMMAEQLLSSQDQLDGFGKALDFETKQGHDQFRALRGWMEHEFTHPPVGSAG